MTGVRFFGVHRTWEDWAGMIVGALIAASPWLTGQTGNNVAIWNAVVIGTLVLVLAALQLASLQLWEEVGEILCGLWLITSPFNFGYAGTLATWHFILGGVVVVLAAIELWQDWNLSEDELARHGQ
jgi:hypothetical protein